MWRSEDCKGDIRTIFKYLKACHTEDEASLFSLDPDDKN